MPKITVTYILPDEQSEYEMAMKAGKYLSVLYAFTNWIREKVKYSEKVDTTYNEIKDEWWRFLNEENIDPYDD